MTSASPATFGYPLYDAHGINVATLTKSGSNSWRILNTLRAYDAWGNVAVGRASGGTAGLDEGLAIKAYRTVIGRNLQVSMLLAEMDAT